MKLKKNTKGVKLITQLDVKRLHNFAKGSSNLGEQLNDIIVSSFKKVSSKTLLVLGSVSLGIVFFIFGLFGRKR